MDYLLDEASRLNVSVETAELPGGEQGRYLHESRRIIIDSRLDPIQERDALRLALGHAYHGDQEATVASRERAELRSLELLTGRLSGHVQRNTNGQVPASLRLLALSRLGTQLTVAASMSFLASRAAVTVDVVLAAAG